MKFRVLSWEAKRAGSMYGKARVVFDDYLVVTMPIRDGKNGLWASLPSSKWTGRDGKDHYDNLVEFADKETAARFQRALISALVEKYPDDFSDRKSA
jgi:DNA-binding cell septation regulator SpoVG